MATGAGSSDALEAVVLAAGSGSRFGGGKLLAPWGAGLLIEAALSAAFAAPARVVTLVTGSDAEAVARAGRAFAERIAQPMRLRIVHAKDHGLGMGHSLRAGIGALPPDAAGAFVFLGDMPRVPHDLLPGLAQSLARGAPAAAPVFEGRRGNPVLIGRRLVAGARAVLQGLGERLALVEASDDGVLFDVDRPQDLA